MTTKEEKLEALNNMLRESYDITNVYNDNRTAVLSELICDIEHNEMKLGDKEWLKVVIKEIQENCNDFNEQAISLGAGIAIGVILKHIK